MDVETSKLGEVVLVAVAVLHTQHLATSIRKMFEGCQSWRAFACRMEEMDDTVRHGLVFQAIIIGLTVWYLPAALARVFSG